MKLNENECKVLTVLADDLDYCGFCYSSFARIADNCLLDVRQVRRACRSLARKGLAEYKRGLWTEEGEPAGSGYGATKAGSEALPLPKVG